MESIIRDVRDINDADRHALEHVVGQPLRENQRLVIQLTEIEPASKKSVSSSETSKSLPAWCDVYAGLSEQQISQIESTALTRANLSRSGE